MFFFSRVVFWGLALAGTISLVRDLTKKEERNNQPPRPLPQNMEGVRVSLTQLENGYEVVRLKGSFDDVMRALDPTRTDTKPPLPSDLDQESLPKYYHGCPHCGQRSMYGEGVWRYHELSRTRGPYDNTTTFLCRCKKCDGFMKATVDHDD